MGHLILDFANARAAYAIRSVEVLEHDPPNFSRYNCGDLSSMRPAPGWKWVPGPARARRRVVPVCNVGEIVRL